MYLMAYRKMNKTKIDRTNKEINKFTVVEGFNIPVRN